MELLGLVGRRGMYCPTSLDAPVFLLALAKAGKSSLVSPANFSRLMTEWGIHNPYTKCLQVAEVVAHSANKSPQQMPRVDYHFSHCHLTVPPFTNEHWSMQLHVRMSWLSMMWYL